MTDRPSISEEMSSEDPQSLEEESRGTAARTVEAISESCEELDAMSEGDSLAEELNLTSDTETLDPSSREVQLGDSSAEGREQQTDATYDSDTPFSEPMDTLRSSVDAALLDDHNFEADPPHERPPTDDSAVDATVDVAADNDRPTEMLLDFPLIDEPPAVGTEKPRMLTKFIHSPLATKDTTTFARPFDSRTNDGGVLTEDEEQLVHLKMALATAHQKLEEQQLLMLSISKERYRITHDYQTLASNHARLQTNLQHKVKELQEKQNAQVMEHGAVLAQCDEWKHRVQLLEEECKNRSVEEARLKHLVQRLTKDSRKTTILLDGERRQKEDIQGQFQELKLVQKLALQREQKKDALIRQYQYQNEQLENHYLCLQERKEQDSTKCREMEQQCLRLQRDLQGLTDVNHLLSHPEKLDTFSKGKKPYFGMKRVGHALLHLGSGGATSMEKKERGGWKFPSHKKKQKDATTVEECTMAVSMESSKR